MSKVYLNGQYVAASEARISPMDRGFLFGDGIYEVIPSYGGRMVGFLAHMERLANGLAALDITNPLNLEQWRELNETLIRENGSGDLGVYIHVSRGADVKRAHAYPVGVTPTVFAYAFPIPPEPVAELDKAPRYKAVTSQDLRWQRCHIKSTALLGNVMHHQYAASQGAAECILLDENNLLTEGSATNVFMVKNGVIRTPELSYKILPGVTRKLLLDIVRQHGNLPVQEGPISEAELRSADEIWLTSSSKEIAPVVELDGKPVGTGQPGQVWLQTQTLFSQFKYQY